ncbi:DnaD domain-containing protein [Staphylococcus hominis]|uniref:DnaD domain-containing protein n=2 Tax=Staphylococcus hominis TaxID=1290 RepID=UPI001F5A8FA2|nr:DnaD domain protein [Staphylococcus hominis]MCI2896231.1 DnaD domain protein [Staphylococcus hominis]MDS3901053.1 DnaD domain protein [Staphylococcus hominis]
MPEKTYIPGGYILLSRRLIESEIWDKPPMYLKVWIYILTKARHKANQKFSRGELLISIPEIQEACSHKVGFRKVKPTKDQIYNIIEWLRSVNESNYEDDYENDTNTTMIATTKTTRGMVVKVLNYNVYQDPKNYEDNGVNNYEDVTKTTTKAERKQRLPDTIHKNVKNEKNDKNVKNEKNVVVGDDFATIYNLYQENIEQIPSPITTEKLTQDMDHYGKELVAYAIRKAALNNSHNYKFIDYLLKDWRKRNLTTIKAVEQYEQQRQEQKGQSYQPKVTQSREKTPEWLKNRNQEKETVDDDPEFEKLRLQFQKQLESDWDD